MSTAVQSNNSPTRNPTIVEHLTSQIVTTTDPSAVSKKLMSPPETQDSNYTGQGATQFQQNQGENPRVTVVYIKQEDAPDLLSSGVAGSSVTVGEHLRHCYNNPAVSPPVSKQLIRRPPILERKSSLQNVQTGGDPLNEPPATCPPGQALSPPPTEFHSRSAPPIDISVKDSTKQETSFESEEALRKSKQVAGVIDSVVEKIRRQNVAENSQQPTPNGIKRPSSRTGPTPPSKTPKVEQKSKPAKPLASIITTQPLPSTNSHMQLSPQYNVPSSTQQTVLIQQGPISNPQPNLQSAQIHVPLVTAEQESAEDGKIVARYMCPECLKL